MKKSLILAAILCLFSTFSFAKENVIESGVMPSVKINKDDRDAIAPFDFKKVYAEAETYFKAAKAWHKLKCTPNNGFICSKHECKKRSTKTFLILDKKKELITRCEGKTCESFPAEFKQTGVFYNIQTEGPVGTLIRVLGDSRYKEITTVGLDAYIANGNCEVVTE